MGNLLEVAIHVARKREFELWPFYNYSWKLKFRFIYSRKFLVYVSPTRL